MFYVAAEHFGWHPVQIAGGRLRATLLGLAPRESEVTSMERPDEPSKPRRDGVLRTASHGPLPGLLLLMTVVTGAVDAVSILRLGRVFVANMTGNVVFAGFAVVGAPGFALGPSLVALAGFLVGAGAGGWLAIRQGRD